MPLLETHTLVAHYGDFQALFGIDIRVEEGETVAIIGANGAGKTTLMKSISGILNNAEQSVVFESEYIGNAHPADIMGMGVSMVPEGRKLFPSLSVEENITIGTYGRKIQGNWDLDSIYGLFPALKSLKNQPSTSLSGGQQQMVAIGRALMSNPKLLLCDEISLGLAPIVIQDIYKVLPQIKASGTSIIIVEQDISQALRVADRIYCMMEGKITLEGSPVGISRESIHAAYFGAAA